MSSYLRQHTSAYVSIRHHTSAYVIIRQHTSAYVDRGEMRRDVTVPLFCLNQSHAVRIKHTPGTAAHTCSSKFINLQPVFVLCFVPFHPEYDFCTERQNGRYFSTTYNNPAQVKHVIVMARTKAPLYSNQSSSYSNQSCSS
jgi:hypothetical protein